jgi:hypothetical protein
MFLFPPPFRSIHRYLIPSLKIDPLLFYIHGGNQDVKTNIIGKKRTINKAQMRANVEDFMNRRKKDKKLVQKYFHVKHMRYVA